jgi:hypothetical protein
MNDGNCNTPERIALLEAIRGQGKTWDVLAARWGVTNENPPWKTSLVAMCGCIGTSEALPALDIRQTEDQLADTVYKDTRAHTLLARGLVDEKALAKRMQDVRARLEAA